MLSTIGALRTVCERREMINEKMKILQDLVPGCNNVIGKELIINYIQLLQHQVEITDYVICRVTKNAINKNRIREEGQVMLPAQEEMKEGPPQTSKEINNTIVSSTSGAYQVVEYLANSAYVDTGSAMVQLVSSPSSTMLPAPQEIEGGPTMIVPSWQEINNTFSETYQVEEHLANSAYADIRLATAQSASLSTPPPPSFSESEVANYINQLAYEVVPSPTNYQSRDPFCSSMDMMMRLGGGYEDDFNSMPESMWADIKNSLYGTN